MRYFDLKIINGEVVDFDNNILEKKNVGIKNGKIVEIGDCRNDSEVTINAAGKIVSPGFIDIHMHEEVIGKSFDNDDFDIANRMLRMGVTTCLGGNCGFNSNGTSGVSGFIDFIDTEGSPVNYLLLAGYNSLREEIGIYDRYRTITKEEHEKIYTLLIKLINEGLIGISFGLEYSPGISYEEMLSIANRVKKYDIMMAAHFRADGDNAKQSMEELIKLSSDSGLSVEISHIGSCAAVGYMSESLEVIRKARKEGIDIGVDCYPYDAFSTFIGSAVFDEGWRQKWNKSYEDIILAEKPYKGIACDEELFNKIRKDNPEMYVIASVMNNDEIIEALQEPYTIIASDGVYQTSQGHPRGAGTFPRILGYYVREIKALTLIDALKKMTLYPAEKIGLAQKGEIKINMDADITIFDPNTIIDKATFENPIKAPIGIEYVIIDGKIACNDNKCNRVGKFIRRSELSR